MSRWFSLGADSLVGSLVDLLSSRSSLHTYVAFIDIHKAFDTSWVEGTLVRFDAGVSGPFPPNHRFGLAPPSLNPGLTLVLLKDVSYLLSCSTCW